VGNISIEHDRQDEPPRPSAEFKGNELRNTPLNDAARAMRENEVTPPPMLDINQVHLGDVASRKIRSWHEAVEGGRGNYRSDLQSAHERMIFRLGLLHAISIMAGRNSKVLLDERDQLLRIDEELAEIERNKPRCICGFSHPAQKAPDQHRPDCPMGLAVLVG